MMMSGITAETLPLVLFSSEIRQTLTIPVSEKTYRGFEVATLRGATPHADSPVDFANNYPSPGVSPDTSKTPAAWTQKMATLQLPNFGPSSPNNGYPTYAGGESPSDTNICSFTYQCTTSSDLVNPPDGVIAVRDHSSAAPIHEDR